ncbi:hypothetical protein DOY81_013100 [Sarcophaga bullata]|nr:hypothetical protein DOY81_013100 [Sarcophaga bullata]
MTNDLNRKETIQDIAFKLAEEQFELNQQQNGPKERTSFHIGQ